MLACQGVCVSRGIRMLSESSQAWNVGTGTQRSAFPVGNCSRVTVSGNSSRLVAVGALCMTLLLRTRYDRVRSVHGRPPHTSDCMQSKSSLDPKCVLGRRGQLHET